ncbi:MAG: N-acetylglucosamine-6-phosphate deacetylase [Treponema sp.]|nr:N-acetylglucosamine-6-phosphate deacetylase [Treponema sp.]
MSPPVCLHNGTVFSGFAAMERCSVLVENGRIADVFSERRFSQKRFESDVVIVDVDEAFISPGFIDTHIHGFGGFGTDDSVYQIERNGGAVIDGTEAIIEMSRLLVTHGVTAFNPTLYPAPEKLLISAASKVSAAIGKESGARIMGLHLEGPFISPDKLGVQRPETVSAVDLSYMERLWAAANGHVVNMTVAPEIKGMRELALFCVRLGIVLQAGHTDARYENMVEGMQAGILHSTHLFNAMSWLDHRNPNAVGAVLTHPEMSCEIIADGAHVHPDLFKLLMRTKPIDKIVLITDGLRPTAQVQGPFFANGEEVVFHDGLFHREKDDIIAGSGLTMIRGIQNLVKFGFGLEDAIKTASSNPAAIMRYTRKGAIVPGMDADITVFDKTYTVLAAMVGGELRFNTL